MHPLSDHYTLLGRLLWMQQLLGDWASIRSFGNRVAVYPAPWVVRPHD